MSSTDEYSLNEGTDYRGPEPGSEPVSQPMSILIRETDHNKDIHIKTVWETDFDKKAGITSKKKYSDVFAEELDWDKHHQKWSTERTEGTDMWEIDLTSIMLVAAVFVDRGVDVTIDPDVYSEYLKERK